MTSGSLVPRCFLPPSFIPGRMQTSVWKVWYIR